MLTFKTAVELLENLPVGHQKMSVVQKLLGSGPLYIMPISRRSHFMACLMISHVVHRRNGGCPVADYRGCNSTLHALQEECAAQR